MSANDRQVGGTHYGQKELQHWDLVAIFEWDYFTAQITKYLMRWKHKHSTQEAKLEDLKKAQHFLEKYIEVESQKMAKKIEADRRGWIGRSGEFVCFHCGTKVTAATIEDAEKIHGSCALPRGYVDQG